MFLVALCVILWSARKAGLIVKPQTLSRTIRKLIRTPCPVSIQSFYIVQGGLSVDMKYQHFPERMGKRLLFSILLILALAIFFVVVSSDTRGEEVFVDDDALPGGNGSEEYPFSSITTAVAMAEEGDDILVKAGEYQESVMVDKRLSIRGEGRGLVNVSPNPHGFSVFNIKASWVKLSLLNLSLNGSLEETAVGVFVEANHTQIQDCDFTVASTGVVIWPLLNWEPFMRNETQEAKTRDYPLSGLVIENSSFTDCLFSSMHASNYFSVRGRLPQDKERMLRELEYVLARKDPSMLRPEFLRGL